MATKLRSFFNKLNGILLGFDRFPEPIKLNFNKKDSIPSLVGFVMTFICYSVVFVFGFQRVQQLYNRQDPLVSVKVEHAKYSSYHRLSFAEVGFNFAIGVVNYDSLAALIDESRVEWKISLDTYKDLQIVNKQIIDVHVCRQDDFDKFYPVVQENNDFLQLLRKQDALFCLNDDQDIEIRGKDEIDGVILNMDLIPCQETPTKKCANDTLRSLQEFL